LIWYYQHVDYLPGEAPEALLLDLEEWTETVVDAKTTWEERARKSLGRESWENVTSLEILGEQERALGKIDPLASAFEQIRDRVKRFLQEDLE
jgi:hypothetical protein